MLSPPLLPSLARSLLLLVIMGVVFCKHSWWTAFLSPSEFVEGTDVPGWRRSSYPKSSKAPCPHPWNDTEPGAVWQTLNSFWMETIGAGREALKECLHVVLQGGLARELPCCSQSPCVRDKPIKAFTLQPCKVPGLCLTRHNLCLAEVGQGPAVTRLCGTSWATRAEPRGPNPPCAFLRPRVSPLCGQSSARGLFQMSPSCVSWESPGLGPDVSDSPELLHFLLLGF